jgi:hypothetical protein
MTFKHHVSPSTLRYHKHSMHWLDGFTELILDGFEAAPTVSHVSREAAAQSQLHRGIEENAEAEELANARRAQQP